MLNILYTSIARAGGVEVAPGTEIVPQVSRGRAAPETFAAIRAAVDHAVRRLDDGAIAATRPVQPQAR